MNTLQVHVDFVPFVSLLVILKKRILRVNYLAIKYHSAYTFPWRDIDLTSDNRTISRSFIDNYFLVELQGALISSKS